MKKTLIILAALTLTTPAFAQSFCECNRNVLPFGNKPAAVQDGKIATDRNGLNSFAMVPRASSDVDSDSPAITGGGSAGYNAALRSY